MNENTKTRINYALVLKTTLEDVNELKQYLESNLIDTNIIYQLTAPRWEKLFIKKEDQGGRRQ